MDFMDIMRVLRQFEQETQSFDCIPVKKLLTQSVRNKKKLDAYIVLTTSENDQYFGHFLLIVRTKKLLFFYDSFGFDPSVYQKNILIFINRHKHHEYVKWNRQVQSFDSITCGAHVLHILYFISQCHDIRLGVELYRRSLSSNLINNDKSVVRFLYKTFIISKKCEQMFCDNINSSEENCKSVCFS